MEHLLVYLYDEKGAPIGLKYRTNSNGEGIFRYYFFEKNLQGDIVAIYNHSGTKIGSYSYDAWGVCTTTTLTNGSTDKAIATTYNPFRYRGYYYDVETGYYYLQSRYYNPRWGRFLNSDRIVGSGGFVGYNLFAYCINNPIVYVDKGGDVPRKLSAFALMANKIFELYQGWKFRIDPAKGSVQRHIHVFNEQLGQKYAQNIDGSNHDNDSNNPPNKIKRKLAEKKVWEWKEPPVTEPEKKQKKSPQELESSSVYGEPMSDIVMEQQAEMIRQGMGIFFWFGPFDFFGGVPYLYPIVEPVPVGG